MLNYNDPLLLIVGPMLVAPVLTLAVLVVKDQWRRRGSVKATAGVPYGTPVEPTRFDRLHIRDNPELTRLLRESVKKVEAMSPDELEEMLRKQRDGYVKAEMSWPRSRRHVDKHGNIVFESYEDFLNG